MTARRYPLIEAVGSGQKEKVIELLGKGYDVNEKDYVGGCAVMTAVKRNDLPMLTVLIGANADVDVKHPLGRDSALSYAQKRGFHEVAELLEKTLIAQKKIVEKSPQVSQSSFADASSKSPNFFKEKVEKADEECKQQTPPRNSPVKGSNISE